MGKESSCVAVIHTKVLTAIGIACLPAAVLVAGCNPPPPPAAAAAAPATTTVIERERPRVVEVPEVVSPVVINVDDQKRIDDEKRRRDEEQRAHDGGPPR